MSNVKNSAGRFFLRNSSLLSLALLLGRLSGFVREIILASSFGVSGQADIAVLVLTLPDLLIGILLSGGLSVALIPRLRTLPTQSASNLFFQASALVFLAFTILASFLAIKPNLWVNVLAPGMPNQVISTHFDTFTLILLALPLGALAGVTTAYHNSKDQFFIAGLGTLIFNTTVIFSLLSGNKHGDLVLILAFGVVGGALFRWLSQLVTLPPYIWQSINAHLLLDLNLLKAFMAAAFSSSLVLIVPAIVRAMASSIGVGQIAAFNYANKLVELPVGVLITTVGTILYPRLSELYAKGEVQLAQKETTHGIQRAVLMSIAVLIPGICFADSVVEILFVRGQLDSIAATLIVQLTRILLLGVPFLAVSKLATDALNASNRTVTVLRIAFLGVLTLPIMALPGNIYQSPILLMSSLVLFSALQAALLSRSAHLHWFGESGWLTKKFTNRMIVLIATMSPGVAIDYILGIDNHYFRLLLMMISFTTGLILIRNFSAETNVHAPKE